MIRFAQQLTGARTFRAFIVLVILLAGVLAGLETSQALMCEHGRLLHTLDRVVLGIFIVEIALKIVALGRRPLDFFRDGWNVFDFLIVAFCLLPGTGTFGAVLRLGRVLRLLRLVTALPKLQLLVGALLKSLSAMGYVSLLQARCCSTSMPWRAFTCSARMTRRISARYRRRFSRCSGWSRGVALLLSRPVMPTIRPASSVTFSVHAE